MLDLIVRAARLPEGKQPVDIAVRGDRIVEIAPRIEAAATREIDAGGHLVSPPFVDPHFHMDATLSLGLPRLNRSGTLLGRHRAVGRAEAAADGRGGDGAGAALLRSGGVAGPAGDPQPCRCLRRPADRDRGADRGAPSRRALYRPATGGLSARRAVPQRQRRGKPAARAGHGRRCGRRHPAFRTHDGGRRRLGPPVVRDRGRTRPAGRSALRRKRRSDVAPHRDAGGRDHAAGLAGPGGRLASAPRCIRWTITTPPS